MSSNGFFSNLFIFLAMDFLEHPNRLFPLEFEQQQVNRLVNMIKKWLPLAGCVGMSRSILLWLCIAGFSVHCFVCLFQGGSRCFFHLWIHHVDSLSSVRDRSEMMRSGSAAACGLCCHLKNQGLDFYGFVDIQFFIWPMVTAVEKFEIIHLVSLRLGDLFSV